MSKIKTPILLINLIIKMKLLKYLEFLMGMVYMEKRHHKQLCHTAKLILKKFIQVIQNCLKKVLKRCLKRHKFIWKEINYLTLKIVELLL
jgi:hypothetical protein